MKVPVVLAVSSLFLAGVLTGLTVTATQMDFGNGSLTRVSCCIDKGCNTVTDGGEVLICVIQW